MPTLVIKNVPVLLYDRIQDLVKSRHRTPADTVLEVLETAFRSAKPVLSEAPLPHEPLLTAEISAPCSIPRPEGKPARAVCVAPPIPTAHDLPDAE